VKLGEIPVRHSHDGITLWYATPDAPAPRDGPEQRDGLAVTVAVEPAHPSNTVLVRYRVDQGPDETTRAIRIRTDFPRRVDYFRAIFPDLGSGESVAYVPIASCAGRQAPDPETIRLLPTVFRLGAPLPHGRTMAAATGGAAPSVASPASERLPFNLEYLATIRVPLKEPEIIGVTPEGIKVAWYWFPAEGTVDGPRLKAKVRRLGGDWMTIRPDGIGVMDVRATLETHDGALLYVSYLGYFELGENGYQDFLAQRWPQKAPTRTAPQFDAAHPNYLWLNRVQCLGIGEVRMAELVYTYDLYAVR
jgi:hypothetical protein